MKLQSFLILALDGGKCSTTRYSRFYPGEKKALDIQWTQNVRASSRMQNESYSSFWPETDSRLWKPWPLFILRYRGSCVFKGKLLKQIMRRNIYAQYLGLAIILSSNMDLRTSQDQEVMIMTGYLLHDRDSISGGAGFLFRNRVLVCPPSLQSSIHWIPGALSHGV
jgi:hypothetical protein